MEHLIKPLIDAGLDDKEARVYVSLLQLGTASSYAVSEKSGLKKPTTYVILDGLITKGIVAKVPGTRKQRFTAIPPEELIERAEQRVSSAKDSLRELQSLKREKSSEVKTLLFEGINGLKEALNYRFDEQEGARINGFWAKVDNADKEVIQLFLEHDKRFSAKKIKVSGITPNDESTRIFREKFANVLENFKLIPKGDYSSDISIEIALDFVRILDPIEKNALIIENRRVAETMRQIFNMVMERYRE